MYNFQNDQRATLIWINIIILYHRIILITRSSVFLNFQGKQYHKEKTIKLLT